MPGGREGFQKDGMPESQYFLQNFFEMLRSNRRLKVLNLHSEDCGQAIQTKETASWLTISASLDKLSNQEVPNPGNRVLF